MTDWTRGDEAICICGDSWWRELAILGFRIKRPISHGPRKGEKFQVTQVILVDDDVYLELDRYPLEGWHSGSFRKPDKGEGSKRLEKVVPASSREGTAMRLIVGGLVAVLALVGLGAALFASVCVKASAAKEAADRERGR